MVPWSLYFFNTKWVAVLNTDSIGPSLSDTNWAIWRMVLPLDEHSEIIGAAHEIHGLHLAVLVNALCYLVKAHAPLRESPLPRLTPLLFLTGVIPVNQCVVSADNVFLSISAISLATAISLSPSSTARSLRSILLFFSMTAKYLFPHNISSSIPSIVYITY